MSSCSAKYLYKKLFTREDPVYLHKILGITALCSFIYRYAVVYPTTGTLGFDGSLFDWVTMLLHLALSSSSLIFHVLLKRIPSKPMVIWHEYRLHAIVFTLRCFSVFTVGVLKPFKSGSTQEALMLLPAVLIPHLLADEVTRRYGPEDKSETTIRVSVGRDQNFFITAVSRFYSFYQFAALGSHLLPNARLADLGFNTLVAIQSSAFLMTLFRKGLIEYYTHGIWYTFCLVLSMFHMFKVIPGYMFPIKLLTAFGLRVFLRMNKYIIWTSFVFLSLPAVQDYITQGVQYVEPQYQIVMKEMPTVPTSYMQLSAGALIGVLGFQNSNFNFQNTVQKFMSR